MLKKFGLDIWTADGPNITIFGFHYPTRMAIIRLSNGGLFIWSPILLTHSLQAEVDALGQVQLIIAPNLLHHLFVPEWKRAEPGLGGRNRSGADARQPYHDRGGILSC